MTDRITRRIVGECLRVEEEACLLYRSFISLSNRKWIQQFWDGMSKDEQEHIAFWKSLVELDNQDKLPDILENSEETLGELEEINEKLILFKDRFEQHPSLDTAILLAYRMEFYLLHPVFADFFQFMKPRNLGIDPARKYDEHLRKFVDTVAKFGSRNPELELLGETLQRIWKRNIELAQQNSTDYLTGIYNRRGFFSAVKPLSHLSQRNDQSVGIMLADVDDFKKINDRLGHEAGDEVLKKVAGIMKSSVRTSDLVARYGGEEFIVFISTAERDSVRTLAEKIRKNVESGMKGDARVTVSIGVADSKLPRDVEEGLGRLIRQADKSLYHAKSSGKNRVARETT